MCVICHVIFVHDSQVIQLVQVKQLVVYTCIRARTNELHLEERRQVSSVACELFGA